MLVPKAREKNRIILWQSSLIALTSFLHPYTHTLELSSLLQLVTCIPYWLNLFYSLAFKLKYLPLHRGAGFSLAWMLLPSDPCHSENKQFRDGLSFWYMFITTFPLFFLIPYTPQNMCNARGWFFGGEGWVSAACWNGFYFAALLGFFLQLFYVYTS